MDLNQLYFDHQLLLIGARGAASQIGREECRIGAAQVAAHIGTLQRRLGASAAPLWEVLAAAGPPSHPQGCTA